MNVSVRVNQSRSIAMCHQIAKEGHICIKIRLINIYFVSHIRIP